VIGIPLPATPRPATRPTAGIRSRAQRAARNGQFALIWLLLTLYGVEPVDRKHLLPFYKFRFKDFRRLAVSPDDRSQFFGFPSSRRSFLTNLLIVIVVCAGLYESAPRWAILRTIYNNTTLTMFALGLGFTVADVLGPKILMAGVCLLSRYRPAD
jgi:hypothetical protein